MLVYRIEDDCNVGVFNTDVFVFRDHKRHLTPMDDELPGKRNWEKHTKEHAYGCESIEQLLTYFNSVDIKACVKHDMQFAIYKVAKRNVLFFKTQVAFVYSKAKLIKKVPMSEFVAEYVK